MHCFNLTAPYAVLPKLAALRLECVHYRLNWAEKGVYPSALGIPSRDQKYGFKTDGFAHIVSFQHFG